jgi:hypothetical protein
VILVMDRTAHLHGDRQVRPRGECPGCDAFWDRQAALLADMARRRAEELGIGIGPIQEALPL